MFYDRRDKELKEISNAQYIDYDTTVRGAIDALTELPFLFFENYLNNEDDKSSNLVITAADLNKRVAKEMMFSLLADLENTFADLIERKYSNSQSLFSEVSPATIGRWKKAGLGGIQMHITEYMTLSEMQKAIAKSEELRSQVGFNSRNQFDKQMSGIVDLRNRVMHANRTIIETRDDVEQLQDRISRIEELI
jgi:predicted SpoU family rRNA methylase